MPFYVAVVGPSSATSGELDAAHEAGVQLASAGVVVVTGGLDGVMGAATSAAASVGGVTVGLLPGSDRAAAHPSLTIALPTGLGELRNALVVRSADAVLAIGGSWGTLSEVALAMRTGVPVVSVGGWSVTGAHDGPRRASTVDEAVQLVLELLASPKRSV
jgi:uncharacterized protein (TIGR00725 family)